MEKRKVLAVALGVTGTGLALLLGSGCRTAPTLKETPAVTVWRADGTTELSREVSFGTPRLAHSLRITEIGRRVTGHGLLNPSVSLVSTYGGTLKFEYRFCWYDGAGYEIGADTSSWKPVALRNSEAKTFEAVAPTAEVEQFVLRIRSH
jgi:uncharacterized protein YcfL